MKIENSKLKIHAHFLKMSKAKFSFEAFLDVKMLGEKILNAFRIIIKSICTNFQLSWLRSRLVNKVSKIYLVFLSKPSRYSRCDIADEYYMCTEKRGENIICALKNLVKITKNV